MEKRIESVESLKKRIAYENKDLEKLEFDFNRDFKILMPYYEEWKAGQLKSALKLSQLDEIISQVMKNKSMAEKTFEERILLDLQDCFRTTYQGKEYSWISSSSYTPGGCVSHLDVPNFNKLNKLISKNKSLPSPVLVFLKQNLEDSTKYNEKNEYTPYFNDNKSEFMKDKNKIDSIRDDIAFLNKKMKIAKEEETKREQAVNCASEVTIKNQRLKELVTQVNDEISYIEDIVYTFNHCRDLELTSKEKLIQDKDFCYRFEKILKGSLCHSHFRPIKGDNCDTPENSTDSIKVLSCELSLANKSNMNNCQEDYVSKLMLFSIQPFCQEIQTKQISMNSEEFKTLRKILSQNLTSGVPVGFESQNKTFSIIGIKPEGDNCSYLIRNYEKKVEEWVSEKDILPKIEKLKFISRESFVPDLFFK
jgi:hypothetical protein